MWSSFINSFPKWIWVWDRSNNDNKKETSIIVSLTTSLRLLTSGTYLIFETWILGTPTLIEWSVDGRLIKDFLPFFAKYGEKNFLGENLRNFLLSLSLQTISRNYFGLPNLSVTPTAMQTAELYYENLLRSLMRDFIFYLKGLNILRILPQRAN